SRRCGVDSEVISRGAAGVEARRLEGSSDGCERAVQFLVVGAADRGRSLAGANQTEQHPQRRRLACTAGPEEPGDRPGFHREGETGGCFDGAESLREPAYFDCCSIRHITTITIPLASGHTILLTRFSSRWRRRLVPSRVYWPD